MKHRWIIGAGLLLGIFVLVFFLYEFQIIPYPSYSNEHFQEYFHKKAGAPKDDIYPTVTVRQIMWALRMKPLKKEKWETVFDRKDV